MLGAGYYKEEGIMNGSDYQRVNVLTNVSVHPTERLTLDNQISLSYTDRSRGGNTSSAKKVEGIVVNPMQTTTLYPGSSYIKEYMLERLNSVSQKNHGYGARYGMVLSYEIIRNLNLKISGSVDYSQENLNQFQPSALDKYYHWSVSDGNIGRNLSILNENLLNYSFTLRQNHNFGILLGLSFQKDQAYSNAGSGRNGPNDFVQYVQGQWGDNNGLVNLVDPALKDKQEPMYGSAYTYSSDFE